MSTTTKRVVLVLPLVVCAWIAVMALVMRFSDAAPAAVVIMPSQTFLTNLPNDAGILAVNKVALTVANSKGMAARLYDAGAWLVLPAGLSGCIPLPDSLRAKLAARAG